MRWDVFVLLQHRPSRHDAVAGDLRVLPHGRGHANECVAFDRAALEHRVGRYQDVVADRCGLVLAGARHNGDEVLDNCVLADLNRSPVAPDGRSVPDRAVFVQLYIPNYHSVRGYKAGLR